MHKLTEVQLNILKSAALRGDHGVAEISDHTPFAKLLKAKLLETVPQTEGLALWERQPDGSPLALAATAAGLEAIGVGTQAPTPLAGEKRKGARKPKAQKTSKAKVRSPARAKMTNKLSRDANPPRSGSKLDTVISMLRRAKGATIDDLMKATGWQAHSVRGAMSGTLKTRMKLDITSEKVGKKRVYRIGG